jgi:hypothetical protein
MSDLQLLKRNRWISSAGMCQVVLYIIRSEGLVDPPSRVFCLAIRHSRELNDSAKSRCGIRLP